MLVVRKGGGGGGRGDRAIKKNFTRDKHFSLPLKLLAEKDGKKTFKKDDGQFSVANPER